MPPLHSRLSRERIKEVTLYCDGSGWNEECCRTAVCSDEDGFLEVKKHPRATSNVMEYTALIAALERAAVSGEKLILSDSSLAVNQINGKWKIKSETLFPLAMTARRLMRQTGCKVEYVPREKNLAGHLLEK